VDEQRMNSRSGVSTLVALVSGETDLVLSFSVRVRNADVYVLFMDEGISNGLEGEPHCPVAAHYPAHLSAAMESLGLSQRRS
jgi:hypothetical protein